MTVSTIEWQKLYVQAKALLLTPETAEQMLANIGPWPASIPSTGRVPLTTGTQTIAPWCCKAIRHAALHRSGKELLQFVSSQVATAIEARVINSRLGISSPVRSTDRTETEPLFWTAAQLHCSGPKANPYAWLCCLDNGNNFKAHQR